MGNPRETVTVCGVCGETMDRRNRQPVCLPRCGHTFCRLCLIHINDIYSEVKCPTCRFPHRGLPPEDLPVNWTLMDLLEPEEEDGKKNEEEGKKRQGEGNRSHTTNEAPPSALCNSNGDGNLRDQCNHEARDSCHRNSDSSTNRREETKHKLLKSIGIAAGALFGGIGLVAAAPVVLTGVGFTSAGVAAGSWAAGMMSSAAIANGGGVAAGSLVAVLQSAGAVGIGTAASATLGSAGAAGGAGIGYGISKLFRRSSENSRHQNNRTDDGDDNDGNDNNDDNKDDKGNGSSGEEGRCCYSKIKMESGESDEDSDSLL